jgi:hypothetical protein
MSDPNYDFAAAVEAANNAVSDDVPKAALLDVSAMDWGPRCSIVKLPIGPNGAPSFLALDTTPKRAK